MCRCAGVSGGAAWASSLIQASGLLAEWGAGCPLWSWPSSRSAGAAGAWVPGRLAIPVPVSRCGADPLARMN